MPVRDQHARLLLLRHLLIGLTMLTPLRLVADTCETNRVDSAAVQGAGVADNSSAGISFAFTDQGKNQTKGGKSCPNHPGDCKKAARSKIPWHEYFSLASFYPSTGNSADQKKFNRGSPAPDPKANLLREPVQETSHTDQSPPATAFTLTDGWTNQTTYTGYPSEPVHFTAASRCGHATGCSSGCDDCAAEAARCCAAPEPWEHRLTYFADALYLHATGLDMAHAQQQNGTGGAGTVPFGVISTADPYGEPAFRAGMNYCLNKWSSLAISGTFFESQSKSQALAPDIGGGGGSVGSFVHHPGAEITGSAGPLDATYDTDFALFDFEYRALAAACRHWWANYSVGVRYGSLEQNFQQTGVSGGALGGTIQTTTDVDFDGVGLKLGLDFEALVGHRGWSIYGRGAATPLFGTFHCDYSMQNTVTGVNLATSSWTEDRFVTQLDIECGAAWTTSCWRVSVGYYALFWSNSVSTPEFIHAVQNDHYLNVEDTFAFSGLVLRGEYRW